MDTLLKVNNRIVANRKQVRSAQLKAVILYVEDNTDDLLLFKKAVRRVGAGFHVESVFDLKAAKD